MRSQGFSFYIWGPGGRGVFVGRRFGVRNRSQTLATACNCPQPLATACNRLQPLATACNRLQPIATACNCLQLLASVLERSSWHKVAMPMGSSAPEVIFRVFQRCVVAFHVAIVALRDMWTCFVTCRESFCVAAAILLRLVTRCVACFVAGAALWTYAFHLPAQFVCLCACLKVRRSP